jgi:hypothetical protein
MPTVGEINLYGLHKLTPDRIRAAISLRSGGPLPPSKGDAEDTLEKLPGVVLARIEAVCCDGPRAILFVGIEEKGEPRPAFLSPPSGDATLPETLLDTYRQYLGAVQRAASRGTAGEDLTQGHPLMNDPEARALQEQFVAFAAANLPVLRDVLRNAAEPEVRAVAAVVINYAPKKQDIVGDLQNALQDFDESVRANAARSLKAIAVLASKQPSLGIKISPTWLVELLNSVVLSDRVDSVNALLVLTDTPNPPALAQMRERALASLEEMARWNTPRYALPPFLLLGRIAGLPDGEVQENWEKGNRETVMKKARAGPARK